MRFADPLVTLSLAVLCAVVIAPLLYRVAGRPGPWSAVTRRTVWAGALCGSGLLVAQALVVDRVADAGGPTVADQAALAWSVAHRVDWAVGLGRALALLGGPGAMVVLTVVCGLVLWMRGRRPWTLVVAATGLGAVVLTRGFKHLYARTRPPQDLQVIQYLTNALPSGHALGSTVAAGLVAAVVVLRPGAGHQARVLAPLAAAGFALAVGVSRVYLGAHWLTDVLTGWLLGGAWLAVGITGLVLLRHVPPTRAADTITHKGGNGRA